ncbi:hypothetical protein A6R68_23446 [Neotoma lepida]|uniref:Uncharacterized protein n=1 Tax=Neotoma lepida TaxID=56216 RepID=A0A1A6HWE7_NEOLE|nr:hypothetical protein A6R68_23446 [Neotoma lepida]
MLVTTTARSAPAAARNSHPIRSCEGVQHAPPSPGPGQSPGTADHPRPTNPIPPLRGSKDLRR